MRKWWIVKVSRERWLARGGSKLLKNLRYSIRPRDNKVEVLPNNVIRLAMDGCRNRPFYRIVVGPSCGPRDSDEIEQLGTYDPIPNMFNEKLCALNFERIKYHMAMGAHVTRPIRRLLGLSGFLPLDPTLVFFAQHLRRRRLIEQKIKERDSEAGTEEKKEETEV